MPNKFSEDFAWKKFEQSGKINDYLSYISFENKLSSLNGEKQNNAIENKRNSFSTT